MYFLFSIVALLSWSGSDLFSKMGTEQKDKLSHWRVIFFVGLIMGIHAVVCILASAAFGSSLENAHPFVQGLIYTDFEAIDFVKYLPVGFIYLLAMVIGYAGLRYIELSISSPICNGSGALAFIFIVILGALGVFSEPASLNFLDIIAVVFMTVGVVGLGYVENAESEELKLMRSDKTKFKYSKSYIAILIPILYLLIDAIGTVGDEFLYDEKFGTLLHQGGAFFTSDYAANTAYELISVCFAIFAFCWVKFVKKQNMFSFRVDEVMPDGSVQITKVPFSKYLVFGGICETIGQIFYMAVMASDFTAGIPLISTYCVLSLIWSRIFLKERLSFKHYIMIAITFLGIGVLALSEILVEQELIIGWTLG